MNETKKNETEFITRKEFKKAVKNMNLMIIGLAGCLLYMWFCR